MRGTRKRVVMAAKTMMMIVVGARRNKLARMMSWGSRVTRKQSKSRKSYPKSESALKHWIRR